MQSNAGVKGLKRSQQGTDPTSHSVRQIGEQFEGISDSEKPRTISRASGEISSYCQLVSWSFFGIHVTGCVLLLRGTKVPCGSLRPRSMGSCAKKRGDLGGPGTAASEGVVKTLEQKSHTCFQHWWGGAESIRFLQ